MGGAFKVVVPLLKSFKDCQELLVIDFLVKLCRLHSTGVESNRVQVAIIRSHLGNDGCNGVV